RAFEAVRYFSYLAESLDAYTTDPEVVARVSLHPGGGWHPWAYSVVMPFRYARDFRRCSILRVFQITGALPAVIAKRRFGIPFVTTYGFWYGRLSRSRASGALRRAVETLGLRAADAVIVTTSELGAHAAAFVLPSSTEGHPKALLEAMSAGVPCIASNVGGNRAIIEQGSTGLLFDVGDRQALADALARVLGDPASARALGERARARVVE